MVVDRQYPGLWDRLCPPAADGWRPGGQRGEGALAASVRRELGHLLNSRGMVGLARGGEVARSVINYGLPTLPSAGQTDGARSLCAMIRQAILDFEPRIDPGSLDVEVELPMRGVVMVLRVTASLRAAAGEGPLALRAMIDLELRGGSVTCCDMDATP